MKVIRHQHIRVQRTMKTLGELGEVFEEEKIVLVGKETGLPVVSALDDVHRQSSDLEAGFARHERDYITELLSLLKGSVPIFILLKGSVPIFIHF